MHIQGVSTYYANTTRTLVVDGQPLVAAHNERVCPGKYYQDVPANGVRYHLDGGRLGLHEIGHIVFDINLGRCAKPPSLLANVHVLVPAVCRGPGDGQW